MAFLAFGTIGEQVKTRLEVAKESSGARDVADQPLEELPSGVTYREQRVGAGSQPRRGDLVVLEYRCALCVPHAALPVLAMPLVPILLSQCAAPCHGRPDFGLRGQLA